jgi:hypothetical protein
MYPIFVRDQLQVAASVRGSSPKPAATAYRRNVRRAVANALQPGEKVLGVTRCSPTSGRSSAPVGPTTITAQATFFLLGVTEGESLRQKMALVHTNRRLLFLNVSLATGTHWAILRTIPIDFVVGVRNLGVAGNKQPTDAEIVFADDSVFAARFAVTQRRAGRRFIQGLAAATSVINRCIPI